MLTLTPPPTRFSIKNVWFAGVNVSCIVAVFPDTDWTNKSAVYEFAPVLTVAYPIICPTANEAKSKEPPSVVKTAWSMSISPASWVTSIVTSVIRPQSVFAKVKVTLGEKSEQFRIVTKFWLSTWPNSEVIVELKFKIGLESGFKNRLLNVTLEL